MSSTAKLDEAVELTERLRATVIDDDSFDALWGQPAAREAFEQAQLAGFDPNEFLIDGDEMMNMAIKDAVKRFFAAYARQIRASICDPHSDVRTSISAAIGAGSGALLMCLSTALAIPTAAVSLVAPIAAILLVKGIDAFCTMDREQPTPS